MAPRDRPDLVDGAQIARVRIRAMPGSRSTELVGRYGDAWKLRVVAAPERGRANDAICAWLGDLAGVGSSHVRVMSGAGSRDKLVEVRGVSQQQLVGLLDAAAGK